MMLTAERTYTEGIKCMGPKETQQMYIRTCIDRSVIVALSAEPPGVNELCVCVLDLQEPMASLVLVPKVGHLVSFEDLAGVMVILFLKCPP
jgi:hypothetical protein